MPSESDIKIGFESARGITKFTVSVESNYSGKRERKRLIKGRPAAWYGALAVVFLLQACGGEPGVGHGENDSLSVPATPVSGRNLMPAPCGQPLFTGIQDLEGRSSGQVEILNDRDHLWITVSVGQSMRIRKVMMFTGKLKELPVDKAGEPLPEKFGLSDSIFPAAGLWTRSWPLKNFHSCFSISLYIEAEKISNSGEGAGGTLGLWAMGRQAGKGYYSDYCIQTCDNVPKPCTNGTKAGEFFSFTQESAGKEAGEERFFSLFRKAFPTGISLGCNYKLEFSSPDALINFIPLKGTAEALNSNASDPSRTQLSNTLAGELVALALALGFDRADENFMKAPTRLEHLILASGPFKGWTVGDIFSEGNSVLGNCATHYEPEQIRAVIAAINSNFSGGGRDGGLLRCPDIQGSTAP